MSDPQAQFEAHVRAAMQPGRIDPQFAARLRRQLAAAARHPQPARRPPRVSRAWAAALLLLALMVSLLAIGPQRVLAQVLGWLGYVPGVGFVESEGGLRVLQPPQTQIRDGIRVDVLEGLIDDQHTVLTIHFDGIRQDQKPTSEDVPGCWQSPTLSLPDGTSLQIIGGEGGGGLSWMRQRFTYPALPLEVNDAILAIPCVPEVLPGLGPEDWEIPLHFVPAPEDFEVLPVQTVQTPQDSNSLHGFSLVLDDYVELEDGYLLRGRLAWDPQVRETPDIDLLDLELVDAQGQRILTEVDLVYAAPVEGETYFAWTLQTNTKQIASPARIILADLSVRALLEFSESNSFQIDLGAQPQDGQVWQVDRSLQLGDSAATVEQVEFNVRQDGMFEIFSHIRFDPTRITNLNLMDLDNQSQMLWWSGAGNILEGQIEIGIGYDYLPTGLHRFWVDNYFERLSGPWEASVTLPPPPLVEGTPQPAAACLTQSLWQSPVSMLPPFAASDRLLIEGGFEDGVYFPALFLSDPRGAVQTMLVPGGWGALSPDGQQVAYTDAAGLHVLAAAGLQDRLVSTSGSAYSPAWSPSADQLAFIKGGDGIWLVAADGTRERRLPDTRADMIGLAGWLPDGQHIVVITNVPAGSQVQQIDVQTGAVQDLFLIDNYKGGFAILSPDGERLAYSGELFGSSNYGLYTSRLDGSQQQLVAEPGDRAAFIAGVWSPDSEWLLVNVLDTAESNPGLQHPIAIRPSTCEVVPLTGILGSAIGWAAP